MNHSKKSLSETILILIVAVCLLGFIISTTILPLPHKGIAQFILMFGASIAVVNAILEFKYHNKNTKFSLSKHFIEIFGIVFFVLMSLLTIIVVGVDGKLIDFGGLFSMLCILECVAYHLYNDTTFNPNRKQT